MTLRKRRGGFGNRLGLRYQNIRQVLRFPHLIPKLARNYLRVLSGKRVLRGVEFAITYECNYSCPHCLRLNLIDHSRAELTKTEILDAARQIEKLGGIFINYTGGEPILRPDIYEIISETKAIPGLLVTLASNAQALQAENLTELKKRGLDILVLSLDAPTAEAHDRFRQHVGSFAKVLEVIDAANRIRIPVWLTAVAMPETIRSGELIRLAELAEKMDCILTLNLPYPVGGWQGREIPLSPAEYQAYLALLRRSNVRWEGSSNWVVEGCPAGVEKIYITPHGDVFPCAVIHTAFGNLRQESLETIFERLGRWPCFDGRRKPCLVAEAPEMLTECLDARGQIRK